MTAPRWRWLLAGPLAASLAVAAPPLAGQRAAGVGELTTERYTLDNGLEVILAPDPSVPVVAVDLWYRVGAANERPGTGFAHLFEHMMFQGSENVGKGEHMQLVERAGGSFNGSTGDDRTNYFETLPSNRVNLALWLEADRMRSLAVTHENLENQIDVVKEERRLNVDNAPYGRSIRAAISTVPYNAATCFAYGHEGIGSMEELEAAELADVQEFFDTFYAPNNATLVVVGDLDVERTRAMIEEYFGDIPRGPQPPEVTCEDPFSALPVTRTFDDANANLPAVFASYGLPAGTDPDVPVLRVLTSILAGGQSSRLYQRIVREEQAAVEVFSLPNFRKGPGLLLVGAIANQGVDTDRLITLLDEEMARVREEGVTPEELEKAKNQLRAQTIRGLQTALGRAEAIQDANFTWGDPAEMNASLERALAVTMDDIRRVARRYLHPDNRATVLTRPAAGEE